MQVDLLTLGASQRDLVAYLIRIRLDSGDVPFQSMLIIYTGLRLVEHELIIIEVVVALVQRFPSRCYMNGSPRGGHRSRDGRLSELAAPV